MTTFETYFLNFLYLQNSIELFAGKHGSNPLCNYIGKKVEALKTKGYFHEEIGEVDGKV